MSESNSHKAAKTRAAGVTGATECKLPGGRRLDACSPGRATEVERSGRTERLNAAARRLRDSNRSQNVLVVPQKDMPKAVKALKKAGIGGTVKNMGGTRRRSVPKPS